MKRYGVLALVFLVFGVILADRRLVRYVSSKESCATEHYCLQDNPSVNGSW